MKILPTFNGYTIDERLREFRKFDGKTEPEFVRFDSPEGQKLLKELHAKGLTTPGFVRMDSYEALKEENELLADLLKSALKQLGKIAFNASSEAEGIDRSLNELLKDF
jgi:hypothetical protein